MYFKTTIWNFEIGIHSYEEIKLKSLRISCNGVTVSQTFKIDSFNEKSVKEFVLHFITEWISGYSQTSNETSLALARMIIKRWKKRQKEEREAKDFFAKPLTVKGPPREQAQDQPTYNVDVPAQAS